tara:strand:+ start:274 stop:1203 length:930 start_codon:yes stop_codon:yes gene_type:complete
MAIIESVNDLYNRVRTILDKGGSPWMSNAEIDDFISMAASEFTQERVDKFGATQRIRDDLGAFVRTITFIDFYNTNYLMEYTFLPQAATGGGQMDWPPINWLASGNPNNFGHEVWSITYNASPISPLSCDMRFSGPYYAFGADYNFDWIDFTPEEDKPDINTVISIDMHYFNVTNVITPTSTAPGYIQKIRTLPVKIISIDDYQGSINDPFNAPSALNPVAIRTGDYYHFLPNEDLSPFGLNLEAGGESSFGMIVFNYVSGKCTTENIVNHMPKSSVEEICQITARKILGTTADERYPVGDAEINQLNR